MLIFALYSTKQLDRICSRSQITIPIAESEGVPIGLSFIAGYGKDMMLAKFCNGLYAKLVRNE